MTEEPVAPEGLPLEDRVDLGAKLRLNVGPPNEYLTDPDGRPALKVRDHYGLLIDPRLYAKKRCNNCRGNGTYQITNAIRVRGQVGNRGNSKVELRTCGCVLRGLQKARRKLQESYDEALRCRE